MFRLFPVLLDKVLVGLFLVTLVVGLVGDWTGEEEGFWVGGERCVEMGLGGKTKKMRCVQRGRLTFSDGFKGRTVWDDKGLELEEMSR